MSFIAGTALLVTELEEDAFWLTTILLDVNRNVDGEVGQVTKTFKNIVPQLAEHLERQGVILDVFVHRWLTTYFTYDLPLTETVHIWDLLVLYGPKFGAAFAIVLLQLASKALLLMQTSDIIKYFNSLPSTLATPIIPLLKNAFYLYNEVFNK